MWDKGQRSKTAVWQRWYHMYILTIVDNILEKMFSHDVYQDTALLIRSLCRVKNAANAPRLASVQFKRTLSSHALF